MEFTETECIIERGRIGKINRRKERDMGGSDNNQMDTDAFSSLSSCEASTHVGVKWHLGTISVNLPTATDKLEETVLYLGKNSQGLNLTLGGRVRLMALN